MGGPGSYFSNMTFPDEVIAGQADAGFRPRVYKL